MLVCSRDIIDLHIPILCPAFYCSFINPNRCVYVHSLAFSIYKVMAYVNRFIFLIWKPFTFSPCLIALVRTSSTMLNRSGESGHRCIVADVRGNYSVFHHYVWCWLCVFCRCLWLGYGSCLLFLICWVIWSWKSVGFISNVFWHLLRWLCGFGPLLY